MCEASGDTDCMEWFCAHAEKHDGKYAVHFFCMARTHIQTSLTLVDAVRYEMKTPESYIVLNCVLFAVDCDW